MKSLLPRPFLIILLVSQIAGALFFCPDVMAQEKFPVNSPTETGGCSPGAILTNDTSLCAGDVLVLSSSSALSYSWFPSTGISDTAIQNPTLTADSSRTYYLTTTAYSAINLVTNGDFELGNTGFTSSLTYTPNLYPAGTYYITTNPQLTHSLFSPCTDHTSGTGNMMVVNGAVTPNVIIWSTTIAVSQNTDYAFSAWITNVSPFITDLPLLQFSINGSTVGPVFTTLPTQCSWNQFYEIWNSGVNTTATITLLNQNTTGSGNDFALDDIEFGEILNCTDSLVIEVGSTAAVSATLGSSLNPLCAGDTVCFTSSITNGGSNPAIQWYVNDSLVSGFPIDTLDMVAWYPFNGNANDESGYGNHGTVSGASLTTDRFGNANRAYHFDGVDDDIAIPDAPSLQFGSDDFTIACWMNIEALTGNKGFNALITKHAYDDHSWLFRVTKSSSTGNVPKLNFESDFPTHRYYANTEIPMNSWHFGAIVRSGNDYTFYLDANADGTFSESESYTTTCSMMISGQVVTFNERFTGKLDDFMIFRRALSQPEIEALYLWNSETSDTSYCYVPQDQDTVHCVVTVVNPCATNNPATSNTIIMNVNPKPVPDGIWHQ